MVIINTKIVLYMKQSCGSQLCIYEVLKFTYNEILIDEYDYEITFQTERFEARWGNCMASQRAQFTDFKLRKVNPSNKHSIEM